MFSVGLVAWNKFDGIIDTLEVYIKCETYQFTKEAVKINKFDKEQHEKRAISPNDAIDAIRSFCSKNTGKTEEIQLAGHNTQFDVSFLKKLFSDQNRSLSRLFSHRIIDTYSVLKYLVDAGRIELDPISSANAFKTFKISVEERHSALGDAIATAKLYGELIKIAHSSTEV